MDLERFNGNGSLTLPMPGRFILDSQGTEGEAVIRYRNPLTTMDLKTSRFPGR